MKKLLPKTRMKKIENVCFKWVRKWLVNTEIDTKIELLDGKTDWHQNEYKSLNDVYNAHGSAVVLY